MNNFRPLGFSLSDAILILFLHDLEKPLAAFVHLCDTTSARIWPDFPKRV
jgi:hypothetical protein